jgi:hypothetical protein
MVVRVPLCQGSGMHGRSTQAGGCLLALSIIIGLLFGIAMREPARGAVIGTGIGIAIALIVWLVDRRRGDRP